VNPWLRRVRAVVVMGLIWALGGIALGGLLELVDNVASAAHPLTRLVDMWPQTLAVVAFPHGVAFAVVLGIARGRRRFEELSLSQFAGWGAVAGAVLGAVALALGAPIAFVAVTTLLSALGGAASLALARTAEERGLLAGGGRRPAAGLTTRAAPPLPRDLS
jgi:O-antigen/teichoic acid export membrane protein